MVNIEELLKIKVEIGKGISQFTMNRGSFKHRETINKRIGLQNGSPEELNGAIKVPLINNGMVYGYVFISQEDTTKIRFEVKDKDFNRLWITYPSDKNEKIYGCGECFTKLNVKGDKVRIWVAEHQNSERISKKIIKEKIFGKRPYSTGKFLKYETYYSQPTFVSSKKYYVHIDSPAYMEFDFTKNDEHTLYICDMPEITLGFGESYEDISRLITKKLGRQPELPDWIYNGVILGMQGGTSKVEKKLELAKTAGVPVTGIWCQDWEGFRKTKFGYQLMWNWEWDEELYPGLDKKIIQWKEEGIRFLGYINPFLAIEKDLYKYASAKGYCVKDNKGRDYMVKITTFPAAMVDFTNPEAYQWIKSIIKKNIIELGISGWMADFGEYLPTDCVLHSKEDPYLVHNTWPAIWAKINREAIEECGKLGEVFFFTRAGSTGTIKYSTMMWNGDQHVDWSVDDGMPSVIPATLSLAMSGYGITHSDAGGYTTIMHMRRSKELLMRWEELCCFSPLLRTHEGNQPENNVQYDSDKELLAHLATMGKIHLRLKNYLKDCVEITAKDGTPVMRPLFYHYDEEKAYHEMEEYLLGRDILVSPVLREGQTKKVVYLPCDEWVDIFTGEEHGGGEVEVSCPIGIIPAFIRKNSKYLNEIVIAKNKL